MFSCIFGSKPAFFSKASMLSIVFLTFTLVSSMSLGQNCSQVFSVRKKSRSELVELRIEMTKLTGKSMKELHRQLLTGENDVFVSGRNALLLLFFFRDANFEIREHARVRSELEKRPSIYDLVTQGFYIPQSIDGFNYKKVFIKMTEQFVDHWERLSHKSDIIIYRDIENLLEFFNDVNIYIKSSGDPQGIVDSLWKDLGWLAQGEAMLDVGQSKIQMMRALYSQEITNPLEPLLSRSISVKPELRFDNSWENPWEVTEQHQLDNGSIVFKLEKGSEHSYRESWEAAVRYPKMAWSGGVVATSSPSLYIGNARWLNHRISATDFKIGGIKNQFKFENFFPKGQSLKNFDPEAIYHFSGWRMLKSFTQRTILLSGNGKLWYHDHFAHYLGYLYLGWFPEVLDRYSLKADFLLSVREILKEEDLYHGNIKKVLTVRANELSRILDFSSGNVTATIATEDVTLLPRNKNKLKGFHILGGIPPYVNNFSRPFRPHFLEVRDVNEFITTIDMLNALEKEFNALNINIPQEIWNRIKNRAKELYKDPLTLDQIFDLVQARPPQ